MATRLSRASRVINLPSRSRMVGRGSTFPEHALHLLVEKNSLTLEQENAARLLLLEVSGAFDTVSMARLPSNPRKRRIKGQYAVMDSQLLEKKKRTTILNLVDCTAARLEIPVGIPQGSPLFPILHPFYKADLIYTCTNSFLLSTPLGYIRWHCHPGMGWFRGAKTSPFWNSSCKWCLVPSSPYASVFASHQNTIPFILEAFSHLIKAATLPLILSGACDLGSRGWESI